MEKGGALNSSVLAIFYLKISKLYSSRLIIKKILIQYTNYLQYTSMFLISNLNV